MKEKSRFLEAGRIVNTHGVRGEVKIEPWCDSAKDFCRLGRIFIDGREIKMTSARVHRETVIAALEGVDDIDAAVRLKNKVVFLDRADMPLPEGSHFVSDLIGLDAVDDKSGEKLGVVSDVLELPAGQIYEIKGARDILVPAVPEFVVSIDTEAGCVRFRLIDGM
ncbi:MAG: 16S rRNA processing protein RimM [Oscillospiraceae bacterium]|nr:16S rRNA processing protein RimM [Oscillospiraceae bacterium]